MRISPKVRATSSMTVTRMARPRAAKTTRGTVLFADLRGYTALAERLPPARIVPLLDEFFGVLAAATALHGGQVFHMAGDGMMAGFGVDSAQDGAQEGIRAGHLILQNFAEVAARWRRELSIETGVGIGLHLGEVALGTLGPPGHKRTTLVGDTVNVAARLCQRARAGEMLFSRTVKQSLDTLGVDVGATPLPPMQVRGRSGSIDIYCVPVEQRLQVTEIPVAI